MRAFPSLTTWSKEWVSSQSVWAVGCLSRQQRTRTDSLLCCSAVSAGTGQVWSPVLPRCTAALAHTAQCFVSLDPITSAFTSVFFSSSFPLPLICTAGCFLLHVELCFNSLSSIKKKKKSSSIGTWLSRGYLNCQWLLAEQSLLQVWHVVGV